MTDTSDGDLITVTGLEVFAHHGVLDEEKEKGQRFLIDLVIHTDTASAAEHDDLERAVDYGKVADLVVATVANSRFDLIETVAAGVAETVLQQDGVDQVEVTVHKPEAPIPHHFDDVAVTISRRRTS